MKKIGIALLLGLLAVGLCAAGYENLSYIKTGDNTYFGYTVKTGLFRSKIITADGMVTRVANKDIEAKMCEGRLYEKLPVVCENGSVNCYALMEYITSKDGFRLYKHSCYNEYCDLSAGIIGRARPEDIYYVFRDGKFHLLVDANNASTVLPFFNIPLITE